MNQSINVSCFQSISQHLAHYEFYDDDAI